MADTDTPATTDKRTGPDLGLADPRQTHRAEVRRVSAHRRCPNGGLTTIGSSFIGDEHDVMCSCGFKVECLRTGPAEQSCKSSTDDLQESPQQGLPHNGGSLAGQPQSGAVQ